jgi:hypothetical protein
MSESVMVWVRKWCAALVQVGCTGNAAITLASNFATIGEGADSFDRANLISDILEVSNLSASVMVWSELVCSMCR